MKLCFFREKFNTGLKDIDVQMMNNIKWIPYLNNSELKLEAISIKYWGNDYSMIIVLPQPSQTIEKLLNNLSDKAVNEILKIQKTRKVDYKIPKFKFPWKSSLVEILRAKGLKTIFENPNFINMVSQSNVKVSDVMHATEIETDEEGTKASAITAVQILSYSAPFDDPRATIIPFYVNRPFLFYIYYHPKDIILFSGVVHKPNITS